MVVGITGHQHLDVTSAWEWVKQVVEEDLKLLSADLVGISCLAEGTDQLFARVVVNLGGRLRAIIPYVGIERSFSSFDVVRNYRDLVKVSTVEVLEITGSDEDCYLAAGRRVVDCSTRMLAVWNGEPARGKGGTADIVRYAQICGVPVKHLNPITRTILEI